MSIRSRLLVCLVTAILVASMPVGFVVATAPHQATGSGPGETAAEGGPGFSENGPSVDDAQTNASQPTATTASESDTSLSQTFSHLYGGDRPDRFFDAVKLGDGSIIAVGRTGTYGNNADGFAARIGADGQTLWTNHYGGSGSEVFHGVTATPDGGALLIGDTNSETYTGGNQSYDGFVVKIDAAGSVEWANAYGTLDDDYLGGAAVTDAGNYLLVGERNFLSSTASDAGWAVTLNPDGSVRDTTVYSSPQTISFMHVTAIGDSQYIAVGLTGESSQSSYDGFVANLRADGSKRWTQTVGDTGWDVFEDAAALSNGSVVVNGYADESEDGNAMDALTAKIGTNLGEVEWHYTYGTTNTEYSSDITNISGTLVTTTVSSQATTIETVTADGKRNTLTNTSSGIYGYYVAEHSSGDVAVAGWTSGAEDAWVAGYQLNTTDNTTNKGLSITGPETALSASSGSTVTVSYAVTNAGENPSDAVVIVNNGSLPQDWRVGNVSGTDPNPQDQFAVIEDEMQVAFSDVDAGETVTVSATVTIPSNATSGDYTLPAVLRHNDSRVNTVNATITVGPQSIKDKYDTDGNGIEITELLTGIEDYRKDVITVQELLEIIDAWRANT